NCGMVTEAQIRAGLANPFADEVSAPELVRVNLAEEIGARLRSDDVAGAERLLLAVGHARACEDPDDPEAALGERKLPRALERRLPRVRGAYLRIVMAAARCRRALLRLRG